MSWEIGNQESRSPNKDFNEKLFEMKGYLEEREAKILLYKFLRENITFTTDLISGVKLFPFQHMAIKAMFETDYFMGVWSRGMSKSFTTAIYAYLEAIMNQGVEIGILSKSFRQAKMIFKKIKVCFSSLNLIQLPLIRVVFYDGNLVGFYEETRISELSIRLLFGTLMFNKHLLF